MTGYEAWREEVRDIARKMGVEDPSEELLRARWATFQRQMDELGTAFREGKLNEYRDKYFPKPDIASGDDDDDSSDYNE